MIALALRFAAGTLHIAPWSAADRDEIEWPPHPARVLHALVESWASVPGASADVGVDDLAAVLRLLAPAPTFLLPRIMAEATRHPIDFSIRRESSAVDSALAISRTVMVEAYMIWPDATAAAHVRDALDRLAARPTSLGTKAEVRLTRSDVPSDVISRFYLVRPSTAERARDIGGAMIERETVDLDAVDLIERLSALRNGRTPGASWSRRCRTPYVVPLDDVLVREQARAEEDEPIVFAPTTLRFALCGSLPPAQSVVAVAEAMRGAALATFSQLHGRPASHRLAGKSSDGKKRAGHDHPYFLPRADGARIDTVDVHLPGGCTHREHRALTGITTLYDPRVMRRAVRVRHVGEAPVARATRWRTATPLVLDRFPKRASNGTYLRHGPDEQVRHAFTAREHVVSNLRCTISAAPIGRGNKSMTMPPAVHVEVELTRSITGPLVLGSLAHFGLGRFEPVED